MISARSEDEAVYIRTHLFYSSDDDKFKEQSDVIGLRLQSCSEGWDLEAFVSQS